MLYEEHHPNGSFWHSLCVVYDAEALGLLLRLLPTHLRFRVVSCGDGKEMLTT